MNTRRAVSLLLGLSLLLALPLFAAGEPVVPDTEAAKHVDKKVSVRGLVAGVGVSRADVTYLNFGKAYPNQTFSPSSERAEGEVPQSFEVAGEDGHGHGDGDAEGRQAPDGSSGPEPDRRIGSRAARGARQARR